MVGLWSRRHEASGCRRSRWHTGGLESPGLVRVRSRAREATAPFPWEAGRSEATKRAGSEPGTASPSADKQSPTRETSGVAQPAPPRVIH